MQQTVAALLMSPLQQEVASATMSIVRTEPASSFESRWSGLQKGKAGLHSMLVGRWTRSKTVKHPPLALALVARSLRVRRVLLQRTKF
jgi:hypothetical protein